jgi:PhnB protein
MATLNPYLNFNGNTEEAFNFYKNVFGGEFTNLTRFSDTPAAAGMAPADVNKLMHVSLPIGKGNTLMGTDAVEGMGHTLTFGNNTQLSLEADSKEEAVKLFDGLSSGGNIEMPMSDQFWGAHFGMLTDKFGIKWMVNYTYPKQ